MLAARIERGARGDGTRDFFAEVVERRCRVSSAAMKLDEIGTCLAADGWPVEVLSETTVQSRFRGKTRVFPMLVHTDGAFVTFAVLPYARAPEEPEDADELLRQLLRWNRQMNLAKFSIDEDDDVVLSVEYRLADLDPSEIRDAVDVVSFYADKYHDEVGALLAAAS